MGCFLEYQNSLNKQNPYGFIFGNVNDTYSHCLPETIKLNGIAPFQKIQVKEKKLYHALKWKNVNRFKAYREIWL